VTNGTTDAPVTQPGVTTDIGALPNAWVIDPAVLERVLPDCASGTQSHGGERLARRGSV